MSKPLDRVDIETIPVTQSEKWADCWCVDKDDWEDVKAMALRAANSDAGSVVVPRELLDDFLAFTGPCDHFDHEGNCQSHYVQPKETCLVKRISDILSAAPAQNAAPQDTSNDLRLPHRDDPATWPASAALSEAGLVERFKAVIPGARSNARVCKVKGDEYLAALLEQYSDLMQEAIYALSRRQPQEDVWEKCARICETHPGIVFSADGRKVLADAIRAARAEKEKGND